MLGAELQSGMRPDPKHLLEHLSRSLKSFQTSEDVFRVLCTLPSRGGSLVARRPKHAVRDLVVLDSSFNPPTKAHGYMATSGLAAIKTAAAAAAKEPGVRRLMLLLAVNNADKAPKPASFPLRLAMMHGFGSELLQGLGKETEVEVDLAVTTLPYFHDKSRAIAQSGFYATPSGGDGNASEQQPEQTFLAGFDTVVRIFNPKYYQDSPDSNTPPMKAALGPFFDRARLRVTMRPDDEWGGQDEQEAYVRELEAGKLEEVGGDKGWVRRLELVEGDATPTAAGAVSSSKARETAKKGGDPEALKALVGGEVVDWIEREKLYRDD